MKNRILVIEDDASISELICLNLVSAGYEAFPVYDGAAAEELILHAPEELFSYDLALLDLMLPGCDGFTLIEPLAKRGVPVICLTARADLPSKVRGLKTGAEDYIVKPFEILELLVRIDKVLERSGKRAAELHFQELKVDLNRRQAFENGKELLLKPMEFRLLVVFLRNRNLILSRERLLNLVWGEDFFGESRTVDVHIAKLRKKSAVLERTIVTVPKGGYYLSDHETV